MTNVMMMGESKRIRMLTLLVLLAALWAATLPGRAFAAGAKAAPTPSMKLAGDGIEFASAIVDGVQAKVHISDVRADMKKLNSAKTHLMAVKFFDAKTNQPIDKGNAAIYFTNDHVKTGFFDPMKNENGIFVTGLLLVKTGAQHATIASKLADGKSRDFHLQFLVN